MLHRVQSAVLLLVLRHGHGRDLESPDNTSVRPTLGDLRTERTLWVKKKEIAYLTKLRNKDILQPKPDTLECYKLKDDEETKTYA